MDTAALCMTVHFGANLFLSYHLQYIAGISIKTSPKIEMCLESSTFTPCMEIYEASPTL